MNAPYIPLELDFDSAVESIKNYNEDMPAHLQAPELTKENWAAFKKLIDEQINRWWIEEFEQFIDTVISNGFYAKETDEIILECENNHDWIGVPEYCSACGVDKGNEREN